MLQPSNSANSAMSWIDASAMSHLLRNGQLGPNQVPVVGAQVAARDGAVRQTLHRKTPLNRDRPTPTAPFRNGWCCHAKTACHVGCRHHPAIEKMPELFHSGMIRHCLTIKQGIAFISFDEGTLGDA
jgi:hypothetical protein